MSGNQLFLDTNIVLYLLNGDETLADFLQEKQLYISIITPAGASVSLVSPAGASVSLVSK